MNKCSYCIYCKYYLNTSRNKVQLILFLLNHINIILLLIIIKDYFFYSYYYYYYYCHYYYFFFSFFSISETASTRHGADKTNSDQKLKVPQNISLSKINRYSAGINKKKSLKLTKSNQKKQKKNTQKDKHNKNTL
eukprot:gene13-4_t